MDAYTLVLQQSKEKGSSIMLNSTQNLHGTFNIAYGTFNNKTIIIVHTMCKSTAALAKISTAFETLNPVRTSPGTSDPRAAYPRQEIEK